MRVAILLFGLLFFPALALAQASDSLVIALDNGQKIVLDFNEIESITFEEVESSVEQSESSVEQVSVYPNPATNDVTLSLIVEAPQQITIEIAREDGSIVRTIEQYCPKGVSTIRWDGLQNDGSVASTGIYLFRAVMREKTLTSKLSLRR